MNKKISIVIPVYNVDKYLRRCIDSIINQLYKDIEIILVDDGSSDKSGEICDEYTRLDNRIKVVHKENGGLSSARNSGINIATGDYIMFVDSDDWINGDTFKILSKFIDKDYDMVMFKNVFVKSEEKIPVDDSDPREYDLKEYIDNVCLNKLDFFVTNKLFRMSLFEKVRFPEGRNYEDLGTIYKLFPKLTKIIGIDSQLYYYWIDNSNSITNTINLKNLTDYMVSFKEIYECIIDIYDKNNWDNSRINYWYKMAILQAYINYLNSNEKNKEIKNKIVSEIENINIPFKLFAYNRYFIKYLLYKTRILPYVLKIKGRKR